jgi:hypothetical protein
VINGNYRKFCSKNTTLKSGLVDRSHFQRLFLYFILTFENLSDSETRKLSEYTNEYHDNRSIHAIYFKRLCHVKKVLPFHKSGKKVSWNNLASKFVGFWYQSIDNFKKTVTIIKALEKRK